MTTNERALYIYNACRKAGMTYAGAIGVLGNLQGEASDFDSMSVEGMSVETSGLRRSGLTEAEYTRRADAGEPVYNGKYFTKDSIGYGIAQWTWWERKQNLLDFAKSQGKSIGDLDLQIEFMIKEMTGYYTPTWKIVSTTDSISKAVSICVTNYEKPANQADAIAKRTAYAKAWAAVIKDGAVTENKTTSETVTGNVFDRKKLVALAESEVGYVEKKSNSKLDDKTANAGSNNYTKYARDLDAIGDFYNGKKQGYAWCDVFVDWLFVKCFGVDNALKLLCASRGSSGAGCTYSLNYYIAKGQYHSRSEKPEVGDQIFFGNVGNSNHTGIVYKVDDSTVYTIEGNTSGASGVVANGGMVCKKSYARIYSQIAGYGRPAYNDGFGGNSVTETDKSTETPTETIKPEKTESTGEDTICTVKLPIIRQGAKSGYVAAVQSLLVKRGFSVGLAGCDGDFGSATLSAVKKFQTKKKLEVDGIVGANTWAALLVG